MVNRRASYGVRPGKGPRRLLAAAAGAAVVYLLALAIGGRLEGTDPEVVVDVPEHAPAQLPLTVTALDSGTGLRRLTVALEQGERRVELDSLSYAPSGFGPFRRGHTDPVSWFRQADLEPFGFTAGEIVLTVEAVDTSLRGWGGGNRTLASRVLTLDLTPPSLRLHASGLHYVRQGGADTLTLIAEEGATVGVRVGEHSFAGCPVEGSPGAFQAFYALPHDTPEDVEVAAFARDAAGNETTLLAPVEVLAGRFRSGRIQLNERFIRNKVTEITQRNPEMAVSQDPLETYLAINRDLRATNAHTLAQYAADSTPARAWSEPFLQLSNSAATSSYGVRRSYFYDGRQVDTQTHLGFDLAATARYPVEAANTGTVVHAGWLGIYGEAVVIDHGCGLLTLYGHLSSVDVAAGDALERGDIVGRSGATGLAGGDHLHFTVIVGGVQVDPLEWWDPAWIERHVLEPYADLRAATLGG